MNYGVPEEYAFHVDNAFEKIKAALIYFYENYLSYIEAGKEDEFKPSDYYTPVLLVGPPGIGKSAMVFQVAYDISQELGLPFYKTKGGKEVVHALNVIDLRISQILPEDFKGLPKFSKMNEEEVVKWVLPEFLPRKGLGILFLDEINLGSPSIQKAAYSLICERRLGGTMYEPTKLGIFKRVKGTGYELPKGWVIIAAMNPESQAEIAYPLPKPLKNRFVYMYVIPPKVEKIIKGE